MFVAIIRCWTWLQTDLGALCMVPMSAGILGDTDLDVEEVEAEVEEVEGEQRGEEHHGHRHQHLGRPLQPRNLPQPAHALAIRVVII